MPQLRWPFVGNKQHRVGTELRCPEGQRVRVCKPAPRTLSANRPIFLAAVRQHPPVPSAEPSFPPRSLLSRSASNFARIAIAPSLSNEAGNEGARAGGFGETGTRRRASPSPSPAGLPALEPADSSSTRSAQPEPQPPAPPSSGAAARRGVVLRGGLPASENDP